MDNELTDNINWQIHQYLPTRFRAFIENNFYGKIAEKAQLEFIRHDPLFIRNPIRHIALFTDHGIVHVRDVARQIIQVIERVNGILIPKRSDSELSSMKGYSLLLAYMHDVGMIDFSDFGRFMHPEYAAHLTFHSDFDDMIDLLWRENAGNIPWWLSNFYSEKSTFSLKVILRELLSLSVAHSKSKVDISLINDPTAFRKHIISILDTPLSDLYVLQKIARLEKELMDLELADKKKIKKTKQLEDFLHQRSELPKKSYGLLEKHYEDIKTEPFSWMIDERPEIRRFTVDVIDCLRCLRAADALRQRGTVLRTSAGYEIFVDQNTANAIYALRSKDEDELFLLEGKKTINAGEANIASSEFDRDGNLRISFHRGHFKSLKITKKAANNLAYTIDDIQADSIQSFLRSPDLDVGLFEPVSKTCDKIQILLEDVEDNPDFSEMVDLALKDLNPDIGSQVQTTVSLQGAELHEVQRYLDGIDICDYFDKEKIDQLLNKISKSGIPIHHINRKKSLRDVRVIKIRAGELLIQGDSTSGFVYIPLSKGLKVYPLGGYASKPAPPMVLIGNTGVIRGSVRNANVFAEKEMELIVIPKQIYLKYWYTPLSPGKLKKLWENE